MSDLSADIANARTILALTLAARGLIEIIDALGNPWARLTKGLLLAALALGVLTAARRSHDRRAGRLLCAVAALLAIGALYDMIAAAITPALPATAAIVYVVLLLVIARGAARHRSRRSA
jgi:peptidoglycan/LPS O-acetylase OafA/YrhL